MSHTYAGPKHQYGGDTYWDGCMLVCLLENYTMSIALPNALVQVDDGDSIRDWYRMHWLEIDRHKRQFSIFDGPIWRLKGGYHRLVGIGLTPWKDTDFPAVDSVVRFTECH